MAESEKRIGNARTNERERSNLDQVNGVLHEHGLAHPFTHLGDLGNGEIQILGAGEVRSLGRNSGLRLVELPAQFTPDKVDPSTGELTPGARGKFWTFFNTAERAAQEQIVIPFVTDAPTGFETPNDSRRSSAPLNGINEQLSELGLKSLPFPVNESREKVTGIAGVEDANKGFFTVVTFNTVDERGRETEKPVVFNVNSNTGIDGSVFVPTIRTADYGGVPRLLIGRNYRPNVGAPLDEIPRGFYNPTAEVRQLQKVKGLTDSVIPTVKRAIDEFNDETGIVDSRIQLHPLGKIMQDPSFEISTPTVYKIDIADPDYSVAAIEPGEKYTVGLMPHGEYFARIPATQDVFTLAAVSRDLIRRGILDISALGRKAQDKGERMVLGMPFRVQHGVHTTEALRTSVEGMPIDDSLGHVAVNSGIARILPEVHIGASSWAEIQRVSSEKDLPQSRLLYAYDALGAIANGELDVVTSAAVVKALHAKGHLALNPRNIV